jgi:hypothetical protein
MDNQVLEVRIEDDRTGLSVETLKRAVMDNIFYTQAKFPRLATRNDWYQALAYTVRDRIVHRWIATTETCLRRDTKMVCYLSAEFLIGPQLHNNLVNLDIYDQIEPAAEQSGLKKKRSPGLETAASDGWLHAIWIRWRPKIFRRLAMESGMNLGFSIKRSKTARKLK